MRYFNSLPKIRYLDDNNIVTVYTNLLTRASVKPSILNNNIVFYDYDVQDEDTPEIIAYKYYGDVNRFWIVLYCNQINDAQWDWPLSSSKFEKFVKNKYPNSLYDIHHYEKIITSTNLTTKAVNVEKYVISLEDYNDLVLDETFPHTIGEETISMNVRKTTVSNYEYELTVNESKRKIKILNKSYVDIFETQFMELMK